MMYVNNYTKPQLMYFDVRYKIERDYKYFWSRTTFKLDIGEKNGNSVS